MTRYTIGDMPAHDPARYAFEQSCDDEPWRVTPHELNTAPDFLQQPTTPAAAKAHHRKDQAASGIADTYWLRMVSNGAPNIEDSGREVEFPAALAGRTPGHAKQLAHPAIGDVISSHALGNTL